MIFITDDSVVLEAVPKEDCKGCYFNTSSERCYSPIDYCSLNGVNFIWKPISNKTKKKLMSLLTKKGVINVKKAD